MVASPLLRPLLPLDDSLSEETVDIGASICVFCGAIERSGCLTVDPHLVSTLINVEMNDKKKEIGS